MMMWGLKLRWIAFVVFWYTPTPRWKLWRGYRPSISGTRWPTICAGPLKVVTGPGAP